MTEQHTAEGWERRGEECVVRAMAAFDSRRDGKDGGRMIMPCAPRHGQKHCLFDSLVTPSIIVVPPFAFATDGPSGQSTCGNIRHTGR